jgi:hypothetical protein
MLQALHAGDFEANQSLPHSPQPLDSKVISARSVTPSTDDPTHLAGSPEFLGILQEGASYEQRNPHPKA